tara:strand:- start:7657 stop:8520 length:864 start_codon:yes stop_codon:yes gene_type:complete
MKDLIVLVTMTKDNACTYLKSQVYSKLNTFNVKIVSLLHPKRIPILKNSVYLILKDINKLHPEVLKIIKHNNNIIIYDLVDAFCRETTLYFDKIIEYSLKVDEIICNSAYHKNILSQHLSLSLSYAYHHSDSRIQNTNNRKNDVFYIGLLRKQSLTIEQMKQFNINSYVPSLRNIKHLVSGIHFDFVLPSDLQYIFHTTTKLATALYTNSIFICNKQPIYLELLGEDYDLYIQDDLSNIQDIIHKAKSIFNDNSLFNDYLNKYKHVRDKISLNTCISMYKCILEKYE